jgi:hypothetical protein
VSVSIGYVDTNQEIPISVQSFLWSVVTGVCVCFRGGEKYITRALYGCVLYVNSEDIAN